MIGRKKEQKELKKLLKSNKSELLAVYGRRRIGKTYMIRTFYEKEIVFHFSGLFESDLKEHMQLFGQTLKRCSNKSKHLKTPTSWFEAFDMLQTFIERKRSKKKKVIFLDEVPWMATHKSRFLTAFENFWNSWASVRKDIIVVICGSAASWMINKVEKNKGGLYNRVTKRIILDPFNLAETEAFLQSKNIQLSRYHIIQTYMILGGIPYYLEQIQKGESPTQFTDRLLFHKKGELRNEFKLLFESLFGEDNNHTNLIRLLAKHREGLKRDELISKLKITSGGGFTKIIEELTASGFVMEFLPYGFKRKEKVYKVIDNFSLFYVKFIENKAIKNFNNAVGSRVWSSWSGLTFENICIYHNKQVIHALGLHKINTEVSSWNHQGNSEMPGSQIDMIIARGDNAINICEIKFYENPFTITSKYKKELLLKRASFEHHAKIKQSIFYTFITVHGVTENLNKSDMVHSEIIAEELFIDL